MTTEEAHKWMQGKFSNRNSYGFSTYNLKGLEFATMEKTILESDAAMMAIAYYTLEYERNNRYGFSFTEK